MLCSNFSNCDINTVNDLAELTNEVFEFLSSVLLQHLIGERVLETS